MRAPTLRACAARRATAGGRVACRARRWLCCERCAIGLTAFAKAPAVKRFSRSPALPLRLEDDDRPLRDGNAWRSARLPQDLGNSLERLTLQAPRLTKCHRVAHVELELGDGMRMLECDQRPSVA